MVWINGLKYKTTVPCGDYIAFTIATYLWSDIKADMIEFISITDNWLSVNNDFYKGLRNICIVTQAYFSPIRFAFSFQGYFVSTRPNIPSSVKQLLITHPVCQRASLIGRGPFVKFTISRMSRIGDHDVAWSHVCKHRFSGIPIHKTQIRLLLLGYFCYRLWDQCEIPTPGWIQVWESNTRGFARISLRYGPRGILVPHLSEVYRPASSPERSSAIYTYKG